MYKFGYIFKDDTLANCLDALNDYIWDIIHTLDSAAEYKLFLTGKKCFRREKYSFYKEKRSTEKPPHWHEIREFLVDEWGAVVTDDGYEADDWIADLARPEYDAIVVSIDKDLNTFEGWKYNPDKRVKFYVTNSTAELWLACQMLIGDTSDNIPGIPGVGKVACVNILSGAPDPMHRVRTAYKYKYCCQWKPYFDMMHDLLYLGQR